MGKRLCVPKNSRDRNAVAVEKVGNILISHLPLKASLAAPPLRIIVELRVWRQLYMYQTVVPVEFKLRHISRVN